MSRDCCGESWSDEEKWFHGAQQHAGACLPARTVAGDHLDQPPSLLYFARPARRGRNHWNAIPVASGFVLDYHKRGCGRAGRKRSHRPRNRHGLCPVALAAPDALPLHNCAADRSHRGHRAPCHPLDRRGTVRCHRCNVHHLPGANHRQHHTGAHQRRRKSGQPVRDL